MKIRLTDGSIYSVTRAEPMNGRMEIDFTDKPCEEIQEIFSEPEKLTNIELLTDSNDKFGEIPGFTVYSGVMLVGNTATVFLIQQADPVQERLTNAEAKALEASILARSAKTDTEGIAQQVTDLQMAMCEVYEGMGV